MSHWSDWTEHDGAAPAMLPDGTPVQLAYDDDRLIRPGEGKAVSPDEPNWFWRWKRVRVGWFRKERRRVCDDPAYSPIIAYRYRRPSALTLLERIAEEPQPLPDEVPA